MISEIYRLDSVEPESIVILRLIRCLPSSGVEYAYLCKFSSSPSWAEINEATEKACAFDESIRFNWLSSLLAIFRAFMFSPSE